MKDGDVDNQVNEQGLSSCSIDTGDWKQRADVLVRLGEVGASSLDAEKAYGAICAEVEKAVVCESVYLHLLTPAGDSMKRYGADPKRDETVSEWGNSLPMGVGRIAQIFDSLEPIIMDYTRPHEQDRLPESARQDGYLSAISVPVTAGAEVFGIISLSFKRSIFWTDDTIGFLEQIGRVAGVSVKHFRSMQKSAELALLEERKRLSAEIHDNVSHHLGSLSLCAASTLESYREGDDERVRRGLAKMETICGDTMRVFRDEMLSLRAPLERTDEWRLTVARILRNFEKEWGIETELQENVKYRPLTMNLQSSLQLTRILNECLSNVLRHSKATRVKVTLYEDGRIMSMSISDNGKGFDERTVPPERLGLKIMRERAAATGGTLMIRSGTMGTEVSVEVPRIGKLS